MSTSSPGAPRDPGTPADSGAPARTGDAPCSVVIPCHGGAALTRACLASLLAQQPAPPAEILIVDNASGDDTATLDAVDARVRVVRLPRNLGFAGGVNAGVREAREPFVLVLNNDTQAASGMLALLLAELRRDPQLGAVAPCSNHVKGIAQLAVGALGATAEGRAELQAVLAQQPPLQHTSTLAGLCLLLRRATFAEVGLFDERFGHGNFEDDDLCLRLRLHGYRLGVAARAFLHHEGHATFRQLGLDLAQQLEQRRAQFVAKWSGDPAGRAHVAAWHGDLTTAGLAARDARHVWPRWADADWHLGIWHAAAGRASAAAAHFAAVQRSDPAHAEAALAAAAASLAAGESRAARAALRAAAGAALSRGQQRHLSLHTGHCAWFAGDVAGALVAFRAAVEIAPDDAVAQNWAGVCELANGAAAAAAHHFRIASDLGFALAHTNLGICLARLGDPTAARVSFERAAALLPDDAVVRANLAACTRAVAAVGR